MDVTWTGADDGINWGDPGNWSDDRVPTQNDAVTIGLGYSSIQVASGTYSVYSITSQSPVEITTGTLVLYGPATFSSGPMTVDGPDLTGRFGHSTGSFPAASSTMARSSSMPPVPSTSPPMSAVTAPSPSMVQESSR